MTILRTITGTVKKPNGQPWAEALVRVELVSSIVAEEGAVYPNKQQIVTCDDSGLLPTGSGALVIIAGYTYKLVLPDGARGDFVAPGEAGDLGIDEVVALIVGGQAEQTAGYTGVPVADAAYLSALMDTVADPADIASQADLDAKADKDTDATTGNVAMFDVNGQAVDAGYAANADNAAWVADGAAGGPLGSAAYEDVAAFDAAGAAAAAQAAAIAVSVAKAGDTMTGALAFSGTNHAGVLLVSLTTVQRDALTPAVGMVIYNSTDAEYQRYDGTYWRNESTNEVRPIYLLYDSFTTTDAAPMTSPRTAEPGPGTGTIVDTGNRMSINTVSELLFDGNGTRTDPVIRYGAVSRVQNLCMVFKVRQNVVTTTALLAIAGFATVQTGDTLGNRIRFSSGNIEAASGSYFGSYTTLATYEDYVDYELAIVLDVSGNVGRHYIRGGAYPAWTELATVALNAATTLYPAMAAYNRAAAYGDVRVAVLPTDYTTADLDIISKATPTRESLLAQFPEQGYASIARTGDDYYISHHMINGAARWQLLSRAAPSVIHAIEKCDWVPLTGAATEILTGGVMEYALNKDGGGFVGNAHGFDSQVSLAISVDGIDRSAMTDGQIYSGREVIVTRVSTLDDTVNTATVTQTYTANQAGFTFGASFDWAVGSNPGGWANMMPFLPVLNSARIGDSIHYALDTYADGVIENRDADFVAMWTRGGNYSTLMTLDRRVSCNMYISEPDKFYSSSGGANAHSANVRLMKLASTEDL
jgi:hypothetical protein